MSIYEKYSLLLNSADKLWVNKIILQICAYWWVDANMFFEYWLLSVMQNYAATAETNINDPYLLCGILTIKCSRKLSGKYVTRKQIWNK